MDSDEAEKKIRKAAEEGKIEFASQEGIESFPPEFVDTFLSEVCGIKGAWISDESSLQDFTSATGDERREEMEEFYRQIEAAYGVDVRGKDNLLDILRAVYPVSRTVQ